MRLGYRLVTVSFALLLVVAITLTVYWLTEPDLAIKQDTVIVVTQYYGESTVIDVPVTEYKKVLNDFELRTQVTNRRGQLVKETLMVPFDPRMQYKFVTYDKLPIGSYEAHVVIGHQLNPLSYREQMFPLAIIYVQRREQ